MNYATRSDGIKTGRELAGLVGDLVKTAGDNLNVKEAGSNLGKAAVIITEAINSALLPLVALNYGVKKAQAYFKEQFEEDMSSKLAHIPPGEFVEPKASVAGPALQGLAFSHEEPNLRDMYLNFLATAMDRRVSSHAHPAFIEIIKQITPGDASLFDYATEGKKDYFITVTVSDAMNDFRVLSSLSYHEDTPGYSYSKIGTDSVKYGSDGFFERIENLTRLHLINISYEWTLRHLTEEQLNSAALTWAKKQSQYVEFFNITPEIRFNFIIKRYTMAKTLFGVQFARAVGIL